MTRRLAGMLARRGYNESMVYDVVRVELARERERRAACDVRLVGHCAPADPLCPADPGLS